MLKRKRIREKGKIKLSEYFKGLEKGDKVAVVRELCVSASFPKILQGRTGIIEGKRGRSYIVKMSAGKDKMFIIHPVHLKKLES